MLINLAPADLQKEGSHFDLAIALAVLAAMEVLPRLEVAAYAAIGELSLDGRINPVSGVLPAAIGASAQDLGLICAQAQGGEAAWAGRIEVLGWAMASSRRIARVEVSCDGGRYWRQASLEHGRSPWSWTMWRIALDLPRGEHELAVRAWDSAGQTQPSAPDDVWNVKGYLSTAWHRIRVTAV